MTQQCFQLVEEGDELLECDFSEWLEMPEFVQEPDPPFAKIIFRFADAEALQAFAKLIGQRLTPRTKSAWFPELQRGLHAGKRWADAE